MALPPGVRRQLGRARRLVNRLTGLSAAEARIAALEARLEQAEAAGRTARRFAVEGFWFAMDRADAASLAGRRLACTVCGREEAREALEQRVDACMFGGGRLERYVCAGCGCIFGPAKYLELGASLVDADYAMLYTDYAEGASTASELRTFDALRPAGEGRYLNWGCGRWNDTVGILRSQGIDAWGYEPSMGSAVHPHILADRAAVGQGWAGLMSHNVVEHMLRPVEEFRYFRRILAEGGRMAHATPCYDYLYPYTRFHVLFLTGDSAHVLAERSGFRIVGQVDDGEFHNRVFAAV